MKWGVIIAIFFLAFAKFMFAPATGRGMGLDFYTAWFSTFFGGLTSAILFYFMSDYFMKRHHSKVIQKQLKSENEHVPNTIKKNFTKTNRTVVRIKYTIGRKGICLFAPLFLSVPIGSIICAKFYRNRKNTFLLIVIGLAMNSFIIALVSFTIL